jgi:hypothetical protein
MNKFVVISLKGIFEVRLLLNDSFKSMQKKSLSGGFIKRIFIYDLEALEEICNESNDFFHMLSLKNAEEIVKVYNTNDQVKNTLLSLSEKFDKFSYTLKAESDPEHGLPTGLLKNMDERLDQTDLDLNTKKLHELLVDSGSVYRYLAS